MKALFCLICMMCAFSLFAPRAVAQSPEDETEGEVVEIPLEEIWAWDMPGTKDATTITTAASEEVEAVPGRMSSLESIERLLRSEPYSLASMKGFAVAGTPYRALGRAHYGLKKRQPFSKTLPVGQDTFVVFFSKASTYDVRIERVTRQGRHIEIAYGFAPCFSPRPALGFALIPLGNLPPTDYTVKLTPSPLEQKYLDAGFQPVSDEDVARLVSRPFSFTVAAPSPPNSPDKDAIVIPRDKIIGLTHRGLRELEPDLIINRDTPEKIKKYSTPEGIAEIKEKLSRSLVIPIERAMQAMPHGRPPGPGFAVSGQGREALPGLYDFFVEGDEPQRTFPDDTDVSVVSYSRKAQPGVYVQHAEISPGRIAIRYMLVSHGRQHAPWTIALIPCGTLEPGEYMVEMVRMEEDEKELNQPGFPPVAKGMESRIICQPFTFVITDQ